MSLNAQVAELNQQLPETTTSIFQWEVRDDNGQILETVPVKYIYSGRYVIVDEGIDYKQTLLKKQLITLPTTEVGLNQVDIMGYELPDS